MSGIATSTRGCLTKYVYIYIQILFLNSQIRVSSKLNIVTFKGRREKDLQDDAQILCKCYSITNIEVTIKNVNIFC